MLLTTNYKMKKIELKDSPPNIEIINPNWDLIDEEMFKKTNSEDLFAVSKRKSVKGTYISESSFRGVTQDLVLEGRTLQNLHQFKIATGSTTISEEVVSYQGNSSGNWYEGKVEIIKPNTKYTMIIDIIENTVNGVIYAVAGGTVQVVTGNVTIPLPRVGRNIVTFTTKSDSSTMTYMRTGIGGDSTSGTLKIKKPILLEGDWTEQELPPYFEGIRSVKESGESLAIESCGRNLFDKGKFDSTDKSVDSSTGNIIESIGNGVTDFIAIKPGLNYSLSQDETIINSHYALYGKDKKYISGGIGSTITVPYNGYFLRWTIPITSKDKAQIEEGSASSYEPYRGYNQAVNILDSLKSLPNGIKDTINFNQNKITKNIDTRLFNGVESWSPYSQGTNETYISFYTSITNGLAKTPIICDKLPVAHSQFLGQQVCIASGSATGLGIFISILKSSLASPDVAGFKAWLQANPVTVYYQLATPLEEQLYLTQMPTFEPKTYIYTLGSLIEPTIYCTMPSTQVGMMGNPAELITVDRSTLVGAINEIKKDFKTSNLSIDDYKKFRANGGNVGTIGLKNASVNNDSIETTKGVLGISVAGNKGIAITSTGIRPNAYSLEHNLGELNYLWNIIYGKTLNLNGTFELLSANATEDMISTSKRALDFGVKWTDNTDTGLMLEATGNETGALRPYVRNNSKITLGGMSTKFKDIFLTDYISNDNGYTKLPNQFIMQWGVTTLNLTYGGSTSKAITFPTPFTNKCVFAICNADWDNTGDSSAAISSIIANASTYNETTANKTGAWLQLGHVSVGGTGWGSGARNIRVKWIALGY